MSLDIFAYLKRSDLCKGWSDQEILELQASMELLNVGAGSILFRKGDLADALYIVCKGAIEIRIPKDDHEETLATLGQNAVLGEVGILTDQVRSATATAVVPTTLLKMSRGIFERLLAEGKFFAFKLVYQIAKILSFRLRQMDQAMVKIVGGVHHSHEMEQLRAKLQSEWPF